MMAVNDHIRHRPLCSYKRSLQC